MFFTWKKLLGIAFVLTLAAVFISSCNTNDANDQLPGSKSFTGEEIFRGIFLGDGKVTQEFPEIWESAMWQNYYGSLDEGQLEALNTRRQEVIDRINAAEPNFLDNFGVQMSSGDPFEVKAAISQSHEVMKTTFSEEIEAATNSQNHTDLQQQQLVFPLAVVAVAASVVVTFVVAATVAAIHTAVWYLTATTDDTLSVSSIGSGNALLSADGQTNLFNDVWVAKVTERLAVN